MNSRVNGQNRGYPTLLVTPSIPVRTSCLYKCMQKSDSSSNARFRRIPHPALLVSRLESVRVCSNKILTICSLSNSFLYFVSSMRWAIALAAADRFSSSLWIYSVNVHCCYIYHVYKKKFTYALWRSCRRGRSFFSRIAANSGSAGGLTGFAVGLFRFLTLFLGFDLPIVKLLE